MSLSAGTRLGPYEVLSAIGAGGMGEVYRARDTRLDRTVAVKIVPQHLRQSPELQARFEREARTISQLMHPHICTLHDIGREGDTDFLVMEFLEGETLVDRLARGPFALDEALRIGMEIASALDCAHRQGIVHRDLKPGNVMLTPMGAKLLDFGLAKFLAPIEAVSAVTRIELQTVEGTLVGTMPYMAPEQVEGKEADARSDIWAFGCLLYELIARRRAFDGQSQASLIAAILERDPLPLPERQPVTPPLVDHIIRTCLAKNPEERWQSAADVKRELGWIRNGTRVPRSAEDLPRTPLMRARRLVVFIGATLLVGAGAALWWPIASRPRPAVAGRSARLSISLSESGLTLVPRGLAVSPDGQSVIFVAKGDGEARLYHRRLTESTVQPLAGSERGSVPFFSPDGEWVGFAVSNRGLFKIPIGGGPTEQVYAHAGETLGAMWDRTGRIVFGVGAARLDAGLWSVSADGGSLEAVAHATSTGAVAYAAPNALPGGRSLLFTIRKGGAPSIGALALGSGEIRPVIDSGTRPWYLPTGDLLYASGGHLRVVPFDVDGLQPRGASRIVVENVASDQAGIGLYAVSATGTLAYISASSVLKRLAWIDRAGAKTNLALEPRRYALPEISTDGRLVAVTIEDGATRDIWAGAINGRALTKLTFNNNNVYSTFTPDNKQVLFTSEQAGRYNIFAIDANGSGMPWRVTDSPHAQRATSISPDGRVMLLNDIDQATALDMLQMEVGKPESIKPFVKTSFRELAGKFSPDGRWVAYASDESGRFEIYVTPFPGAGLKRQVSVGGGDSPVWNPQGGEVIYQGSAEVMSVAISEGTAVGPPVKLFAHAPTAAGITRDWTISSDGKRFLIVEDADAKATSQINVVLNFFEELKPRSSLAR